MHDYRRLDAWSRSRHLALKIYNTTFAFLSGRTIWPDAAAPASRRIHPIEHRRRSGKSKHGRLCALHQNGHRFSEVETQLDLSLDLAFLASDQHRLVLEELREIKAMLRGLEQSPTG